MKVGDNLPKYKIFDQFEKEHVLSSDTNILIVTSSKLTGEIVKEYLLDQEKDFLKNNNAYYIADISQMPSMISKLFAIPKMKEYPFSVLLIDKEQAKIFNKKDDHVSIYIIKNRKVLSINYIKEKEELAHFFR